MDEFRLNTIPSELPVMVLGDHVHFPHSTEALFIFEPRYREMLARVLEDDGLMSVVSRMPCPPNRTWAKEDARLIAPVTTMSLVRAAVKGEEGTSHIMLQGLERVRIVGWAQTEPYRVAVIEPFTTISRGLSPLQSLDLSTRLAERLLALCGGPAAKGAEQQILANMKDPELLADFVAANFIRGPGIKLEVLKMRRLRDRLNFLVEHFGA